MVQLLNQLKRMDKISKKTKFIKFKGTILKITNKRYLAQSLLKIRRT